jgi:indole-3-glycerol phosphate synthase/phosphoribosylanthranilate isomerase
MREIGGVLGEIVARKRIDVAARLGDIALEEFRASVKPTRRSLKAALSAPGARFVMEVKRASPSKGVLREGADPAAIAQAYRGAADAISVLTDTPYFGGSFADLGAVRLEFDGPILAKDFVIDPRQVPEARLYGADAVLVMLSVLDDAEAAAVLEEARRLGMDVLVETHDEAEVARAVALGAEIIGINNRDLKSLTVDLAVTERLARLVPADRLVVSESGIESRADVERLAPYADAFLVGSSLMRAQDPALAARALAYGRVKVCGLTDPDDAKLAAAAGASYAGLIMVPNTPRAVGRAQAEKVAAAAGIPAVGVFRNEKPAVVADTARALGLAAVQLHGDRTLFDTKADGRSGGTGIAFDWNRIGGRSDLGQGIVAGGLGPDNAAQAAKLGAYALDVSSGVESAPGRKDPYKMQAFFDALRVPVRKGARS